jgi:Zn-finger nucleic acid-binding protein
MPTSPLNCDNCGAPLVESVSRRRLVCDFCGSRRPIADDDFTDERIVPLGHPSDVGCPACHTPLVRALVDETQVDFCPDCRGILFPDEAFQHVVRKRRADYRGSELTPVPLDPADMRHRRACPKCSRLMDVHPYYGPGNTIIDSCYNCRHIWLDHGEITRLEQAPGRR